MSMKKRSIETTTIKISSFFAQAIFHFFDIEKKKFQSF